MTYLEMRTIPSSVLSILESKVIFLPLVQNLETEYYNYEKVKELEKALARAVASVSIYKLPGELTISQLHGLARVCEGLKYSGDARSAPQPL